MTRPAPLPQVSPDGYADFVAKLHDFGGGRAWSLMVSLFGDLAQGKGTGIDGPVLSALMAEMRVKPEATRVALHRLRNDGWIASEKCGRIRRHALTGKSRRKSTEASVRIYAEPGTGPKGWQMVLLESADRTAPEKMAQRGFVPVKPRLYIGADTARAPKHALRLSADSVPDWLPRQIAPSLSESEFAALAAILARHAPRLDTGALSPLHCAVLRCLVVHNWRRLVLRHPPLPATVLPPDWAGARCHARVHDLLSRLPRPAPQAIRPPDAVASFAPGGVAV